MIKEILGSDKKLDRLPSQNGQSAPAEQAPQDTLRSQTVFKIADEDASVRRDLAKELAADAFALDEKVIVERLRGNNQQADVLADQARSLRYAVAYIVENKL